MNGLKHVHEADINKQRSLELGWGQQIGFSEGGGQVSRAWNYGGVFFDR
jgi:hypothetical protein